MRIDRLKAVLENLRTVPNEKFDMNCWWDTNNECGCAIGHFARLPDSKLKLRDFGSNFLFLRMGKLAEFDALVKFFDISSDDADHLFWDEMYPGASAVASYRVVARLEKFITEHEAEAVNV